VLSGRGKVRDQSFLALVVELELELELTALLLPAVLVVLAGADFDSAFVSVLLSLAGFVSAEAPSAVDELAFEA